MIDSPDPKPMHHGPLWVHYNHFVPVGVHLLNDFWNECYRTKGIAVQTPNKIFNASMFTAFASGTGKTYSGSFVIHFGGKHIYHWLVPNYANQMEHFKTRGECP